MTMSNYSKKKKSIEKYANSAKGKAKIYEAQARYKKTDKYRKAQVRANEKRKEHPEYLERQREYSRRYRERIKQEGKIYLSLKS